MLDQNTRRGRVVLTFDESKMCRSLILLILAAITGGAAYCDEPPTSADSDEFSEAYDLLYPERTMQKRAEQAVKLLLPPGKKPEALSDKELALLCRAYNQLHKPDEQLAIARALWKRSPGTRAATENMISGLHNVYMFANDNQPLLDFVDLALKEELGNRRELLVFKAEAVISQRKGREVAARKVLASELLVEAYCFNPYPMRGFTNGDGTELIDMEMIDSADFIDYTPPFNSFFSSSERESIKLRMVQAKQTAEASQKKPTKR